MIPPVFAARLPIAPLRFGGEKATRAVQGDTYVQVNELRDLWRQDGDTYLGEAPDVLMAATGLSSDTLGEAMVKIKKHMSAVIQAETKTHWGRPREEWGKEGWELQHWCRNLERMTEVTREYSETLNARYGMTLDYIAGGSHGAVFQLSAGNVSYALRIYPNGNGGGTSLGEATKAIHFTHKNVPNLAHCYWANPEQGWLLMEYIGPETRLADRTGPTFEALNVSLTDLGRHNPEIRDFNDINGIVVDYGCIGWYMA